MKSQSSGHPARRLAASICVFAFAVAAFVSGSARETAAASQTWVGMISDSQCGGDHGGEVDVVECTTKCIKNGFKYVLAIDNGAKVVPIANQDFAGLAQHPGQFVKVTGEMKDGAIVIERIDER
jgi:hypothetical protein